MHQETVLIESVSNDNGVLVSVIGYDVENRMMTTGVREVLPREEAYALYDVCGEVVNGEVQLFGKESFYG